MPFGDFESVWKNLRIPAYSKSFFISNLWSKYYIFFIDIPRDFSGPNNAGFRLPLPDEEDEYSDVVVIEANDDEEPRALDGTVTLRNQSRKFKWPVPSDIYLLGNKWKLMLHISCMHIFLPSFKTSFSISIFISI